MTNWEIKGREFGNCNCSYGCPCQFNALPTHGHCRGLAVLDIEEGFHGTTRLDGLKAAAIFRWPGPISRSCCSPGSRSSPARGLVWMP
jgi:hypothetical protein